MPPEKKLFGSFIRQTSLRLAMAALYLSSGCNFYPTEPTGQIPDKTAEKTSSPIPFEQDNSTNKVKPWAINVPVEQLAPHIIHLPENSSLSMAQIRSLCGEVRRLNTSDYETPTTKDCAQRINLLQR